MPPSRAESVATVGASARARVTYVTVTPFRVPFSPRPPPPLLLLHLPPPPSLGGGRYAYLPLPSLCRIAIPPPPRPSTSLYPLQQSRAPVVGPATTSCVCPTLSLPYECAVYTYGTCTRIQPPRVYSHRATTPLPPSSARLSVFLSRCFHGK